MILITTAYNQEIDLARSIRSIVENNLCAKILVLSPTFRQTKQIFQHLETMGMSLYREVDAIYLRNNRCVYGLSMPKLSSRLQGLRPEHLVLNCYNDMPKEVISDFLSGYMAITDDPITRIKNVNDQWE